MYIIHNNSKEIQNIQNTTTIKILFININIKRTYNTLQTNTYD